MCLPNIAEKMKPYFFFSILFIVLLLGLNKEAEANRLQQHYWNEVMGDEAMPDAIKDLLPTTTTLEGKDPVLRGHDGESPLALEDLINKDFDTSRSVNIIYHHPDDHHA